MSRNGAAWLKWDAAENRFVHPLCGIHGEDISLNGQLDHMSDIQRFLSERFVADNVNAALQMMDFYLHWQVSDGRESVDGQPVDGVIDEMAKRTMLGQMSMSKNPFTDIAEVEAALQQFFNNAMEGFVLLALSVLVGEAERAREESPEGQEPMQTCCLRCLMERTRVEFDIWNDARPATHHPNVPAPHMTSMKMETNAFRTLPDGTIETDER